MSNIDNLKLNLTNFLIVMGVLGLATGMDCSGKVDTTCDSASASTQWSRDADGDDYGDASDFVWACDQPEGYVLNTTTPTT
jgi:hypothetical protein